MRDLTKSETGHNVINLIDVIEGTRTAAEWLDSIKKKRRWGRWLLRKRTNELVFYEGRRALYWIDLDHMRTSAECLDWIFQLHDKTWMTNEDRGDLLDAIRDLINPQGKLCSFGIERGGYGEKTTTQ